MPINDGYTLFWMEVYRCHICNTMPARIPRPMKLSSPLNIPRKITIYVAAELDLITEKQILNFLKF